MSHLNFSTNSKNFEGNFNNPQLLSIYMAVIKTTNKEIIDRLQAKLALQTGRQFTQQEIVDLCIEFAQENFEELINRASNVPLLTPQLADQIIKQIEELDDVQYDLSLSSANDIDKDIYSL